MSGMEEDNILPEIDISIIEEAKKAYGLSEQNVNSILRHTIKQFHEIVSGLSARQAEDEPVASRVKGARKKRRSAPAEPLIDTATAAPPHRRVSLEPVSVPGLVGGGGAGDDDAEWKLFLAALDDDVGLAELFPESEDEEYCAPDEDADDDSEELRNDRAVHIPRKEVAAIKRLADKNIDALFPTLLAGVSVQPPAARYVLTPAQRCALAGRVRDAVQLCAQLALHSEPMRAGARPLLQALADKAQTSWLTCTLPDSRPSLFTPDLKHIVTAMLAHGPAAGRDEMQQIVDGWPWASRALLPCELSGRKAAGERRSFLAVEDQLLVWGLRMFCPLQEGQGRAGGAPSKHVWALIHVHCLPVWEPRQIHLRYKNRTARHKPTNNIKEWKRTHVNRNASAAAAATAPHPAPGAVFEVDVVADPDQWEVDIVPQTPPSAGMGLASVSADGPARDNTAFDMDMLACPDEVYIMCISETAP